MTLRDKPTTRNRGVHTNERVENIQDELRTVINRMGPDTSNLRIDFSPSEATENSTNAASIIEIDIGDKEIIQQLVQDPSARPLDVNTPRDYSELSSLATDSIALYIDQKQDNCEERAPNIKNIKDFNINIRNPLRKISSLFLKQPREQTSDENQEINSVHTKEESVILPQQNVDLYRINILQPKDESAPKRVVFDLVEDLLPCTSNVGTNTSPRSRKKRREAKILYRNENCNDTNQYSNLQFGHTLNVNALNTMQHRSEPIIDASSRMQKKTIYQRTLTTDKIPGQLDSVTRVDVYYFDHGNSAYYHTTDCPPVIMTEILAERTENYTAKFWAEAFGFLHIVFSFITSFILQLLRSSLQSFVRPLTVGILQILSDYCIKPLLATIFNALVQPPLIFVYNIATSLRDICDPIAEGMGYFIREIGTIFSSIRLVDIKYGSAKQCIKRNKRKQPLSQTDATDLENN